MRIHFAFHNRQKQQSNVNKIIRHPMPPTRRQRSCLFTSEDIQIRPNLRVSQTSSRQLVCLHECNQKTKHLPIPKQSYSDPRHKRRHHVLPRKRAPWSSRYHGHPSPQANALSWSMEYHDHRALLQKPVHQHRHTTLSVDNLPPRYT